MLDVLVLLMVLDTRGDCPKRQRLDVWQRVENRGRGSQHVFV